MSSFIFLSLLTCLTKLSLQSSDGQILDLTYPLNNITLDWGGDKFQLNISSGLYEEKSDISYWYQSDTLWTPTHLGTHLDAPCHFAQNKWCVSDIPIERLYRRPGYVIDVSSKIEQNENYLVTANDIAEWVETIGNFKPGAVILVRTNRSKHWPDRNKYFGIKNKDGPYNFPGISTDAVMMIFDKGIDLYGIGIESPSVDNGPSKNFSTHTILASHNVFNLENIGPLIRKLPKKDFFITALPIKIDGASGSPVRLIAHVPEATYQYFNESFAVLITLAIVSVIYFLSK